MFWSPDCPLSLSVAVGGPCCGSVLLVATGKGGIPSTADAGLPLVPLFTESRALGDVFGYVAEHRRDLEQEAYQTLYPSYAIGAPGALSLGMTPVDRYLLQATFAIPGHILGQVRSAQIPDRRETALSGP